MSIITPCRFNSGTVCFTEVRKSVPTLVQVVARVRVPVRLRVRERDVADAAVYEVLEVLLGSLEGTRVLHAERQRHPARISQPFDIAGAGDDPELVGVFRRQRLDQVDQPIRDLARLADVSGTRGCVYGHERHIEPAPPGPRVVELPFRTPVPRSAASRSSRYGASMWVSTMSSCCANVWPRSSSPEQPVNRTAAGDREAAFHGPSQWHRRPSVAYRAPLARRERARPRPSYPHSERRPSPASAGQEGRRPPLNMALPGRSPLARAARRPTRQSQSHRSRASARTDAPLSRRPRGAPSRRWPDVRSGGSSSLRSRARPTMKRSFSRPKFAPAERPLGFTVESPPKGRRRASCCRDEHL